MGFVWFILGTVVGGAIGGILMALLIAVLERGREADEQVARMAEEQENWGKVIEAQWPTRPKGEDQI